MTSYRLCESPVKVNENCTGSVIGRLSYDLVNRKAKARKQERRKKHIAIKRWKREQKQAKKNARQEE
tara:strand:- start:48 stop:248 length:201 start_codon:yes stop_codon:yes gene_type:complete